MADDNDADARRRDEVARLRAAARSTTPEAYRVKVPPRAYVDTATQSGVSTLFGAMTAGGSKRDTIATTLALASHGIAYVILILLLNLAQCEWWYEPGMYSGSQEQGRVGGR